MQFAKYHGLGNDYLVVSPEDLGSDPSTADIRLICDRHLGIGSDGVLLGPISTTECHFALRIFNPDGSEAEKSGNGLRIFARYLFDRGLVQGDPFTILTIGGRVRAVVHRDGESVTVDMGRASFDSASIPVAGPAREVLEEQISVGGADFRFSAATVGNPHCVIFRDEVTEEDAKRWGPSIESDPRFPNRTNVQFVQRLDPNNLKIEIWERGAGYTLASGSSSCAAAAVACRLGLCNSEVTVHMPGGTLSITVSDHYSLTMTGPVVRIAEGTISAELLGQLSFHREV